MMNMQRMMSGARSGQQNPEQSSFASALGGQQQSSDDQQHNVQQPQSVSDPLANLQQMLGGAPGGLGGLGGLGALGGLGGLGGLSGLSQHQQNTDTRPPEERYETQLSQLREMGFLDARENVRALMATGGDVQAAIEYILSQ